LLYPSAKHRSVQIALNPIQNEGLNLAEKMKWVSYKTIESKNDTIGEWKIEVLDENRIQMIRNVFWSGKLVLEISKSEVMNYSWKYYPSKKSKPEYLYIAP